jgi:hypothetical protein
LYNIQIKKTSRVYNVNDKKGTLEIFSNNNNNTNNKLNQEVDYNKDHTKLTEAEVAELESQLETQYFKGVLLTRAKAGLKIDSKYKHYFETDKVLKKQPVEFFGNTEQQQEQDELIEELNDEADEVKKDLIKDIQEGKATSLTLKLRIKNMPTTKKLKAKWKQCRPEARSKWFA